MFSPCHGSSGNRTTLLLGGLGCLADSWIDSVTTWVEISIQDGQLDREVMPQDAEPDQVGMTSTSPVSNA